MLQLWKDAHSGIRVVKLTELGEVEALVQLFEEVAAEEKWEPNGALRLWLQRSAYFALEVQGKFVGGLQLVQPDVSGALPCQAVWPEVSVASPRLSSHVAVLALNKTVRGQGLLFWRLVVEMWRHCVGEGITTLYIEVTPRVLPIYRRIGWPLQVQGELRQHWGEGCYLCTLGIPEVAESMLRRAEQSSYCQEIVAQAFRVKRPPQMRRVKRPPPSGKRH